MGVWLAAFSCLTGYLVVGILVLRGIGFKLPAEAEVLIAFIAKLVRWPVLVWYWWRDPATRKKLTGEDSLTLEQLRDVESHMEKMLDD